MGTNFTKPTRCKRFGRNCFCPILPFLLEITHGYYNKGIIRTAIVIGDCYMVQQLYTMLQAKTIGPNCCQVKFFLSIANEKEPKLRDLLVSHNPWDKQNYITRHYQSFPLQIPLSSKSHSELATSRISTAVSASDDSSAETSEEDGENGKFDKLNNSTCETTACQSKFTDMDELDDALDLGKPGIDIAGRIYGDQLVYVTAGYPDNHNPLLSRSLQRKLDMMSPREFLTFVLKELSLDERESLMLEEKQRRKTYQVNWPHDDNRCGAKMAQAGFYSLDSYDRVQCVFCRGSLHRWESDDTPMREHAKAFPFCRFVKGLECGNKEYRNNLLTGDELKNLNIFSQLPIKKNRDGTTSIDSNLIGICINKAEVAQYAIESARLRTFGRWPQRYPIEAAALCSAGFYYTGFDDTVRCFYCSGTLSDWKEGDEPFTEHARWFPDCSFLLQLKGEKFVKDVHARTEDHKKCSMEAGVEKRQAKEVEIKEFLEQEMVKTCVRLGHSLSTVLLAIHINGGPFSCVKDLLNAVFEVEESDELIEMPAPRPQTPPSRMVISEDDRRRALDDPSLFMNAVDNPQVPTGCCINCFNKTRQSNPARHIGLPCGHMLYCDKCNQEEMKKSMNPNHKNKCLYTGCQAPLSATFRTFYA